MTTPLSPLASALAEQCVYKIQKDARRLKHEANEHRNERIGQMLRRQSWLLQGRAQALLELLGS